MTTTTTMTTHKTGTREEWLAARLALLQEEKELTQRSDEVAQRRQELPWVAIDKHIDSTRKKGASHWQICSKGARSCWSTTSCSARL